MQNELNCEAMSQYRSGTRPDRQREELLNRLCSLREDPRFAEWCQLTSALGLGRLALDEIAALDDTSADALFPEVGEWVRAGHTDVAAAPPRPIALAEPADRDGEADLTLGAGVLPGLPVAWLVGGGAAPVNGAPLPFVSCDDAAFDGRIAHLPARNGRAG